jgi:hypothetical protein
MFITQRLDACHGRWDGERGECSDFPPQPMLRILIRPIPGTGPATVPKNNRSLQLASFLTDSKGGSELDHSWLAAYPGWGLGSAPRSKRRFLFILRLPSVFCWGPSGSAAFALNGTRGRETSTTKHSGQEDFSLAASNGVKPAAQCRICAAPGQLDNRLPGDKPRKRKGHP